VKRGWAWKATAYPPTSRSPASAAFKAANRSLKSGLTGTLSPPFVRLERHVPDERQALGGRNASPELAIEGPVVAVKGHDTARTEASLLATVSAIVDKATGTPPQVSGQLYDLPKNDDGLEAVGLEIGVDTTLVVRANGREHRVPCRAGT